MIIGITGKKQHGKNEVANIIGSYVDTADSDIWYNEIAFTQPLKDMIEGMLDLKEGEAGTREFKDGIQMWDMTGRDLLQVIGADIFRNSFRTDVWTSLWKARVFSFFATANPHLVVAPDVRFDNEAKLVHELGGIILHVQRVSVGDRDPHSSERGIDSRLVDEFIDNNGTLEDLQLQVLPIVKRFIFRNKGKVIA